MSEFHVVNYHMSYRRPYVFDLALIQKILLMILAINTDAAKNNVVQLAAQVSVIDYHILQRAYRSCMLPIRIISVMLNPIRLA